MKKGGTAWTPIVEKITDIDYSIVDNTGADFVIMTNEDAPNKKVLGYNTTTKKWKTIIPEDIKCKEDIVKMIEAGSNSRDRAIIACFYESLATLGWLKITEIFY